MKAQGDNLCQRCAERGCLTIVCGNDGFGAVVTDDDVFFWQLQLLGAEKRKISGRLRLKLKLQGKCQNVLGGQWQPRRMNDGNRQSFQMFRDSPAAGKSSPLSEDFFQAKTDPRLVARRS